jgi:hypothetical protein
LAADGLVLQKAIMEIRFQAVINYSEIRLGLFRRWTDRFPDIKLSSTTVELSDAPKKFKVFSEWQRAGGSIEGPVTNFANFRDVVCNFLDDLLKAYDLNRLTRIGTRFFYVLPISSFGDLASTLGKSLFRPEFTGLFPDTKDVGAALVCRHEQNEYQFQSGPVAWDELASRISLEFEKEKKQFESALFIDIDYRRSEEAEYKIRAFMTEAHRFAESRTMEYLGYLGIS